MTKENAAPLTLVTETVIKDTTISSKYKRGLELKVLKIKI